jgi:hypothetical protein
MCKTVLKKEILGALLTQGHLGKCFPKFSHPGTQRPVPLWSRGAQLTLKLASDLGITHMILVCRHTKCKSNRAWRLPPRFQRKGWKARWYKAESDSLQVVPEWEVHEAVRVKSKL